MKIGDKFICSKEYNMNPKNHCRLNGKITISKIDTDIFTIIFFREIELFLTEYEVTLYFKPIETFKFGR